MADVPQFKIDISTTSQQIHYPFQIQPTFPQIALNGTPVPLPEKQTTQPTGCRVVIFDRAKLYSGDTAPIANAVFGLYGDVNSAHNWMSTFTGWWNRMLRFIVTQGDPRGNVVILATYGLDNNMGPTTEMAQFLIEYGAGPNLQNWMIRQDWGSETANPNAWTTAPVNYVFAGSESLPYGKAYSDLFVYSKDWSTPLVTTTSFTI